MYSGVCLLCGDYYVDWKMKMSNLGNLLRMLDMGFGYSGWIGLRI